MDHVWFDVANDVSHLLDAPHVSRREVGREGGSARDPRADLRVTPEPREDEVVEPVSRLDVILKRRGDATAECFGDV